LEKGRQATADCARLAAFSEGTAMKIKALFVLVMAGWMVALAAEPPPRLKRAESFLGIHFDFHAGADCTNVGAHTTPAMVESIINLVHPDYLQIDCKGHPGFSSYPTKVGQPVPGFVGDPLRVWRDVTAARGVALFMHYSGVYERQAIRNPGWAALNSDGKPNDRATSFFGPYAEKLLIPQLRELAGVYGVDGAWVDGECWAAVPDFGPAAVKAYRETTGFAEVPRKPGQPHWFEFLQFHREQFRKYLRHYITAVKKTNPDFQLCSNWAFTDHMPEPVSAPVDFLSGDYSPENSVNSARLAARYLARQGKPWDLMAWSFAGKSKAGRMQKSAVQLQREAALVLAQGGGFQAYFKQKRDGSIYDEQMPVMGEVAKFCRERQQICHHAQAVPQIGLLLSTADHYRRVNSLFGRDHSRINGVLQALLESQWPVEVLGEHQLAGRLAGYPLLIVPECDYLEPAFRDSLATYAREGGHLLLVGPGAARLFAQELGWQPQGALLTNTTVRLAHAGQELVFKANSQSAAIPGAQTFGQFVATNAPARPAAALVNYGRGRIAATFCNLGAVYQREQPALLRRFISDLVRELFPQPLVEVRGSPDVEVTVMRNHGKLLVNLINTAGPHQTQPILDSIPPVGPLTVTLRLDRKPAAVTLEPGARPLAFDYQDGQLRLTVPQVTIHDIVAVQN
jgi:hypothetical protein